MMPHLESQKSVSHRLTSLCINSWALAKFGDLVSAVSPSGCHDNDTCRFSWKTGGGVSVSYH